jgi:hypothetical protein
VEESHGATSGLDRLTLAIAAGAVVLVLVGIVVVMVKQRQEAPPDLATPSGVALAYVQALQKGEPERAWDLLAPAVQRQTSREQFLLNASQRGSRESQAHVSVENLRLTDPTAHMDVVWTFPPSVGFFGINDGSSYTQRDAVTAELEPDGWRLLVPPQSYLVALRFPTPTGSS